jgi:DNA-binding NarL/FixJ family response regulator
MMDHSQADPLADRSLTPRERTVLQMIAEGMSNKEMADRLALSGKTVEHHRAQLMEKLNLHSVAQLTRYAIRKGLVSAEGESQFAHRHP